MTTFSIRRIVANSRFQDLVEAFKPEHDFDGSKWAEHSFDDKVRFPCPNCQIADGIVRRHTGASNPYFAVIIDNITFRCESCRLVGTRFEVEDTILHSRPLLEMFLREMGVE